jgi:DNA polymerase IV
MKIDTPILHVDMDAFYASVEAIKDPSLRGKPVIVGGLGGRGVVTSASYEARAFGVASAMPIVTARRLCPNGIYVPNDFDAYLHYSDLIKEVFTSFTPLVEPLSLDEAFLDVSGSVRLFGDPMEIGRRIKARIAQVGLACTVGGAPNKFIAKLASSTSKPDGFLFVGTKDVSGWLHPLPLDALWGVGPQTADSLRRMGLLTVGDVAGLSRRTLERVVGEALGRHLHALANGRDERTVMPYEPAKSVGCENTYGHDLHDEREILREVLRLADRTASRLRAKGLCGRTVTLKVRFSNFNTITRSFTGEELDTAPEIFDVARSLLEKLGLGGGARVRLLGVSVGSLVPGPPSRQLDLLRSDRTTRLEKASRAVDDIRDRYGDSAVGPAELLHDPASGSG